MFYKMLLKKGADVNVIDTKGNTPLHAAAVQGNEDCMNALISAGADVNAENR